MAKKYKHLMPFIVSFGILFLVHLFLPLGWSDDGVFLVKTSGVALSEFLVGSARPMTDAMTYIMIRNPLLWRIANPIILTALAIVMSYLLSTLRDFRSNVVICSTVFYPMLVLVDAGFTATTVNYLWPVTFGLICMIPIKQIMNRECVAWYEYILLIPLIFYATNMQQAAVLLFIVFLAANIYFICKKEFHLYPLIQWILSTVLLLYSYYLNMFGNNNRMEREISRYFPDFGQLGLIEKAELGFSSTFYCLTMYIHFAWVAFIVFSGFIMFRMIKQSSKKNDRAAAVFPFTFTIIFGILTLIPRDTVPFVTFFTGNLQNFGVHKASYAFNIVADILFAVICFCVLYSLWVLLSRKDFYASFCLLFLGLLTRIMMGFSPTVWASGFRTFAILILSFIAVTVIVIKEPKWQESTT